jgi:hypothetical protein
LDSKLVCDLLERWPSLEELQSVPPAKEILPPPGAAGMES